MAGLLSPKASLLGLQTMPFSVCSHGLVAHTVLLLCAYPWCLSLSVSKFPCLVKTPARLDEGPPQPCFHLVTSLKTLSPNTAIV